MKRFHVCSKFPSKTKNIHSYSVQVSTGIQESSMNPTSKIEVPERLVNHLISIRGKEDKSGVYKAVSVVMAIGNQAKPRCRCGWRRR